MGVNVGAIATPKIASIPATGNDFIDQSHDGLLRQVRTLKEGCDAGAERGALTPEFTAFVGNVTDHFEHEETILRAIGYGGWSEHAGQHDRMVEQMDRLVAYLAECECAPGFMGTVAETLDAALCQHEGRQDAAHAGLLAAHSHLAPGQALVSWGDDLTTGVERVDGQHRALIDSINSLHRLSRGGALTRQEGEDMLLHLLHDLQVHFVEEEEMIRHRVSTARYLQHERHHQALERQLGHVVRLVKSGTVDLAALTGGFLRFWLIDHIVGADRPLLLGKAAVAAE